MLPSSTCCHGASRGEAVLGGCRLITPEPAAAQNTASQCELAEQGHKQSPACLKGMCQLVSSLVAFAGGAELVSIMRMMFEGDVSDPRWDFWQGSADRWRVHPILWSGFWLHDGSMARLLSASDAVHGYTNVQSRLYTLTRA